MPKKDEKPIMGLVSDKNFIVANAVENILAGKFLTMHILIYDIIPFPNGIGVIDVNTVMII